MSHLSDECPNNGATDEIQIREANLLKIGYNSSNGYPSLQQVLSLAKTVLGKFTKNDLMFITKKFDTIVKRCSNMIFR